MVAARQAAAVLPIFVAKVPLTVDDGRLQSSLLKFMQQVEHDDRDEVKAGVLNGGNPAETREEVVVTIDVVDSHIQRIVLATEETT